MTTRLSDDVSLSDIKPPEHGISYESWRLPSEMKVIMKYIASCSGGKDSVAMVLGLVEKELPLDYVVMVDLGKEFDCIYRVWDRLCAYLDSKGIRHIKLQPEKSFDYYFSEHEVTERKGGTHKGYSWCGGRCRWGTAMKKQLLNRFYSATFKTEPICEYVGIAADERERATIKRAGNIKQYPLILWGMTENDCLIKCYRSGYRWIEGSINLYDVLGRVSCYCCANKNLGECGAMIKYLPDYWQKIKDMETKLGKPYKDIGTRGIEEKVGT